MVVGVRDNGETHPMTCTDDYVANSRIEFTTTTISYSQHYCRVSGSLEGQ